MLYRMTRYFILFIALILASFLPQEASAQDSSKEEPFNGIITDLSGNPIKGAKVFVVSSKYFSRTNKKGQFGLTNVLPTDTIHVVYQKVQYDLPVEGRKSARIRLGDQMEAQEDEELVAYGYGWVKRRENSMPSSGIPGEVLVRTGRTNVLASLEGLVPGLTIVGGKATIRGINSLNLSTDPLYVLDGVVVSSLDFINVYDVEHVEVLKDASIYGSQGANGAILVFTKRGK